MYRFIHLCSRSAFPYHNSCMEDIFNVLWWHGRLMSGFSIHEWIPLHMYHFYLSKSLKTFSSEDSVFTPRYTSISQKSASVFFSLGSMLIPSLGKRHLPGLVLEASKSRAPPSSPCRCSVPEHSKPARRKLVHWTSILITLGELN